MKINLIGFYPQGAYYEVIQDGKTHRVYGFTEIRRLVQEARKRGERIELQKSIGFEEHSKLVRLLNKHPE